MMKCLVLIGTYTEKNESEGVYVYELDKQTGALRFLSSQSGIKNPTYLNDSGDFMYVVSETPEGEQGSVYAYKFDGDSGKFDFIDSIASRGEGTCYVGVSPNGELGSVSNFHSGSLMLFKVDSTGRMTQKEFIQYKGEGPHPTRQQGPHIHQSIFSPDGKYMLVCDLGTDKLLTYQIQEEKDNLLSLYQEINTKPGSGPRHICFHPNGRFVYLIHEIYPLITVFSFDSGILFEVQTIPNWAKDSQTGEDGSAIKITPEGDFLYASCRGDQNEIGIYSVDAKSGKLKNIGFQTVYGSGPRDFEIVSTGNKKFFVVSNQWSNNLVVFEIEKNTGLLNKIQEYSIPSPVCVKVLYM